MESTLETRPFPAFLVSLRQCRAFKVEPSIAVGNALELIMNQPGRRRGGRPRGARDRNAPKKRPSSRNRSSLSLRDKEDPLDPMAEDLIRRLRSAAMAALGSGREGHGLETLELDLRVTIPLGGPNIDGVDRSARELSAQIREQVESQSRIGTLLSPGRVLCLRCGGTHCDHAMPSSPVEVFTGYEPSGRPQWAEFSSVLTEVRDARVGALFAERPSVLARVCDGAHLRGQLLPEFEEAVPGLHLLGQIQAGMFTVRANGNGEAGRFAASVQVIALAAKGRSLELKLNPVGRLPDGSDLARRVSSGELDGFPGLLAVGRSRLEGLARRRGEAGTPSAELKRETLSVLRDLARELEQAFKHERRRTRHANQRADSGVRPTTKAFEEAKRARDEDIRIDASEDTFVVLGGSHRVHVFSHSGRHVTSVIYPPETIRHRTQAGRWRLARPEEVEEFRQTVFENLDRPEDGR